MGTTQKQVNLAKARHNTPKATINRGVKISNKESIVKQFEPRTAWSKIKGFFSRLFGKKKQTFEESIKDLPRKERRKAIKERFYHGRKPKQRHKHGGLKSNASSDACIYIPKRTKFKGYMHAS